MEHSFKGFNIKTQVWINMCLSRYNLNKADKIIKQIFNIPVKEIVHEYPCS
jgi:hypothetical protein